jgi:hypothetical protein
MNQTLFLAFCRDHTIASAATTFDRKLNSSKELGRDYILKSHLTTPQMYLATG